MVTRGTRHRIPRRFQTKNVGCAGSSPGEGQHGRADASPAVFDNLELISRELDRKIGEQERAASSFDAKAGVLLGLAGVIIGFTPNVGPAGLVGRVCAAAAAAFAIFAMLPRISAGLAPRRLRDRYLTMDLSKARLELLDTKILLYDLDERRLREKVVRLRWTVGLLAGALLFLLAGSISIYFKQGGLW